MNNKNIRVHHILVAVTAIVAVSFSLLYAINLLAQTVNIPCDYSCSNWGECQIGGLQHCEEYETSPAGCQGSTAPNLSRSCTYNYPTCQYTCLKWGSCRTDGTKECINTRVEPSDCAGGNPPGTETCIYTAPSCTYTYTDWSACNSLGHQSRQVKTALPTGCSGTPDLQQNCTYSGSNNTTSSSSGSSTNASTSTTSTSTSTSSGTTSTSQQDSTSASQGSTEIEVDYGGIKTNSDNTKITREPTTYVSVDESWSANPDWKKKYFGSESCDESTCGGSADPDNDGLTNNDEVRYGTDPLSSDSDGDGNADSNEVAGGTDPTKHSENKGEDSINYEDPKEYGEVKSDIYQVNVVEMVNTESGKRLKVDGKGPAGSYVTIFIYSGQPITVAVKTDSNGDWTYTVDKELEDGNHEVYVAVTNSSGAIMAKSEPLPFVKTAQAVQVASSDRGSLQETAETRPGISITKLLFIFASAFFLLVAGVVILGVLAKKIITRVRK